MRLPYASFLLLCSLRPHGQAHDHHTAVVAALLVPPNASRQFAVANGLERTGRALGQKKGEHRRGRHQRGRWRQQRRGDERSDGPVAVTAAAVSVGGSVSAASQRTNGSASGLRAAFKGFLSHYEPASVSDSRQAQLQRLFFARTVLGSRGQVRPQGTPAPQPALALQQQQQRQQQQRQQRQRQQQQRQQQQQQQQQQRRRQQ